MRSRLLAPSGRSRSADQVRDVDADQLPPGGDPIARPLGDLAACRRPAATRGCCRREPCQATTDNHHVVGVSARLAALIRIHLQPPLHVFPNLARLERFL